MKNYKINFLKNLVNLKSLRMLLLGFSSGLPILLVFSTLSIWLVKAGVNRSMVTMFSWAGLAYSFKFIWTPIIDNLRLPVKNFGHRKSWLLFSQIMVIFGLVFTSFTDPSQTLLYTAIGAVIIAFASATQDVIIDAYRIESASQKFQGILSSMYIAGYRIAMLVAGAGSLLLAAYLGTETYNVKVWRLVYMIMASLMIVGILTTIFSPEPKIKRKNSLISFQDQSKFLISFIIFIFTFIFFYSILDNPFTNEENFSKFLFALLRIIVCFSLSILIVYLLVKTRFIPRRSAYNAFSKPFLDFINRYGKAAIVILLLISLYRIADVVMGVMANIFYLEKGFNIKEIATYSKFFGVFATIAGGIIGGYSAFKFGTIKCLFFGALIAAASNLLFAWLAIIEPSINFLIIVITADNIASGFAGAAFVVYLSALTSIRFTATQYALFSSLMLLFPKVLAGYSGVIVDQIGYASFYIFTAIIGLPVLILIIWIAKIAPIKD
ncbi:MFS transporter [Pelagibacteraceae bacterium]|nr:MFS transporter [Pelagibacteraceae bacterium]|tara:strand:+ start:106 stop:1587 length:1482 start_codon:yes stop_codon:yes gene_type:complete